MNVSLDHSKLMEASTALKAGADDLAEPVRELRSLAVKIPEAWKSSSATAFVERLQMLARRIEDCEEELRHGAARCKGIAKQVEKTEVLNKALGFNK